MVELERAEAMALLAGAGFGRVVFTWQALPAIRVVNHLVDQGQIIIRTRLSAPLGTAAPAATVVAYQTDNLDIEARTGWSVVVTGYATSVTDADLIADYERLHDAAEQRCGRRRGLDEVIRLLQADTGQLTDAVARYR